MTNYKNIIEGFRGFLHLNQDEFGKLLGVHRNTVSNWEKGKINNWQLVISKIENAFPEFEDYIKSVEGIGDGQPSNTLQVGEPEMPYIIHEDDDMKQYTLNHKQYLFNKKTRVTYVAVNDGDGAEVWVPMPTPGE